MGIGFLNSIKIRGKEKISGIGPSRIATLASFGIETAWDIQPQLILQIPAFGPATATNLIAWRQSKEARFRFNPNHPIAAAEINAIEADLAAKASRAMATLQPAAGALRNASAEALQILQETEPKLRELWVGWKLADRQRRDSSLFWL